MNYFSFVYTKVCNFADDTTFFACDKDLGSLINRLEHYSFLAVEWFQNNSMKLNEDNKCNLLGGYKHESIWGKIGEFGDLINQNYWGDTYR